MEGPTVFTIRWVVHRHEKETVMTETSDLLDADAVVASCLERMPSMREKNTKAPPDGFFVFDSEGNEIRRWFGSARP